MLSKFAVALDPDFIAFEPKEKMTEDQTKALLAYLNSSFGQFQIEKGGRTTGGGMVSLEAKGAMELLMPNVANLGTRNLRRLVSLYEELEAEARKVGGADKRTNLALMKATLERLDEGVALSLGLPKSIPKALRKSISIMMERRVQRAEDAKPEAVRGEEAVRIRPPRTRGKTKKEDIGATQLDRWTT